MRRYIAFIFLALVVGVSSAGRLRKLGEEPTPIPSETAATPPLNMMMDNMDADMDMMRMTADADPVSVIREKSEEEFDKLSKECQEHIQKAKEAVDETAASAAQVGAMRMTADEAGQKVEEGAKEEFDKLKDSAHESMGDAEHALGGAADATTKKIHEALPESRELGKKKCMGGCGAETQLLLAQTTTTKGGGCHTQKCHHQKQHHGGSVAAIAIAAPAPPPPPPPVIVAAPAPAPQTVVVEAAPVVVEPPPTRIIAQPQGKHYVAAPSAKEVVARPPVVEYVPTLVHPVPASKY